MALATMHCGCEVVLPEPHAPAGRLARAKCPKHGQCTFHTVAVNVPDPTQPAYIAEPFPMDHAERRWTIRYEWRLR